MRDRISVLSKRFNFFGKLYMVSFKSSSRADSSKVEQSFKRCVKVSEQNDPQWRHSFVYESGSKSALTSARIFAKLKLEAPNESTR